MEPTLDKCPGYNLYIGGFIGLRRPKALKNCNITHIVSALDWEFKDEPPLTRGYQHLHVPVDDVEDENLLEWFPKTNRFIQEGLDYNPKENTGQNDSSHDPSEKGSGVYIHCAMGKSRSATVLIAYLLWATRRRSSNQKLSDSSDMVSLPPKPLGVAQALELLRQGRPIAEPNEGFMDQLHMYEAMGCPTTEHELKAHKIYRRWMNKRKVDESLRVMQAPEMEHIIFEDESDDVVSNDVDGNSRATSGMVEVAPGISAPDGTDESKSQAHPKLQSSPQVTIKCRKCRHVLATTPFLLEHHPPPHRDPSTEQYKPLGETPLPPPQCAHIFLHPLSWMREVLSESKMEGRLTCPNKRCGTNLGKFAWTGLRCSCGGWVTPGFGIIRTKVDEIIKPRSQTGGELNKKESGSVPKDGTSTLTAAMGGLRFPPGQKRNGNL